MNGIKQFGRLTIFVAEPLTELSRGNIGKTVRCAIGTLIIGSCSISSSGAGEEWTLGKTARGSSSCSVGYETTSTERHPDRTRTVGRLPAAKKAAERNEMALTRNSRETVQARAKRDPAFREGLLREAIESLLSGEVALGKELLRDYINATVGFPKLATHTKIHAKTLHQMFGPK